MTVFVVLCRGVFRGSIKMGDTNISLVSFSGLSKPATLLIEKFSDAVGCVYEPTKIRNIAKANADAKLIEAKAQIEITERQQRGLARMFAEEGFKQENMENILSKAIPLLSNDAQPENIEKDWLTHFFDRCRLTSDEQMQELWAKILAGEANEPSKFSKRTVNIVSEINKKDAELFTKLLTFCWKIDGTYTPFIYYIHDGIHEKTMYKEKGINFKILSHLQDIGLTKDIIGVYSNGYVGSWKNNYIDASYYDRHIIMECRLNKMYVKIGDVTLTQAGIELVSVCKPLPSEEYYSHVIDTWQKQGYILSSPVLKKARQ
jgi:hypothetical protein